MTTLLAELKRRNVFRVGILYLVTGWLILQASDVLFALLGLPDWTLKLVLGFLILGFPFAVIFSWIYEVTPEGIKREKDIDRSQSVTAETGQKINLALGAGLVVAIGLLVYQNFMGPQGHSAIESSPPESVAKDEADAPISDLPSIAVLPFVNMSSDPEHVFFADGLSDTMVYVLSQVGGLKVAARTSSATFTGKDMTVQEIAKALSVSTILEGSVQRAGNRVRVIAQLINASDDVSLWSANLDRDIEDIFAVQDEIAQEVVAALRVTLLDEDQTQLTERYQPSLEAYEQVILGRQRVALRTAESLAVAEQHFKQAIALDPNYALAYSGLADTHQLQKAYSGLLIEDSIRLREPLVARALELDPYSGEAHTSSAMLHLDKGQIRDAESAFKRAIELSPSYASAYGWYSFLLANQNRHEESLAMDRIAFELDPLSPIIRVNYAWALFFLGRVEEAVFLVKEGIDHAPDFANFYVFMDEVKRGEGQIAEALRWNETAVQLNPSNLNNSSGVCRYFFDLADSVAANACVAKLVAEHQENSAIQYLQWQTAMGQADYDEALYIVKTALERFHDIPAANRQIQGEVAHTYLQQGRFEEAHAAMTIANPEFYAPGVESVNDRNWENAIHAGWIEIALGRDDVGYSLFEGAERVMATRHRMRGTGYGIWDVRMLAIRGEKDKALAKLREAIDMGWRSSWYFHFHHDRALESLRTEPTFITMVNEVEADMLAQREWYEANKDVPVMQL